MTQVTTKEIGKAKKFADMLKRKVDLSAVHGSLQIAEETLQNQDFPTTRMEAWKYTRLGRLTNNSYTTCNELEEGSAYTIENLDAYYLYFTNGIFNENASSIPEVEGITLQVFGDVLPNDAAHYFGKLTPETDMFNNLNTLALNNGVFLSIANNIKLEKPIVIVNYATEGNYANNFRNIFHIASGAEIEVNFINGGHEKSEGFTNMVSELWVDANAHLSINNWQKEGLNHHHISRTYVEQEKDATFSINTLSTGGLITRNDLVIRVNGENATSNLNGLYLGKGKQLIDNHTVVDHRVPHCESNELYKGIADEQSTTVFNGKVFVRPDAQKINAFQQNANIVLTDDATVNSKPELEIYADDVKCSHGSVTGQFDEEAVFYLRSRGLSEQSARNLLVSAFAADVLNKITNESIREEITTYITNNYNWG